MNRYRYRFRWAPDAAERAAQTTTYSDGITAHAWRPTGLPLRLSFIRQTREAYYGPVGSRPPGLWKRVLRALVLSNGVSYLYYCPDLPPLVRGVELSVPRFTLLLECLPAHQHQVIDEHWAEPCPGCVAAGWRPAPRRKA